MSPSVARVGADAVMEYASAEALLMSLAGLPGQPARVTASSSRRLAATRPFHLDGGSIDYINADDVLAGDADVPAPVGGFDASTVKVSEGAWPHEGPGREEGSRMQLRKSLDAVLVGDRGHYGVSEPHRAL